MELQKALLKIGFSPKQDSANFDPYTFFSFVFMAPSMAVNLMDTASFLFAIWKKDMHTVMEDLMTLGNYVTGSLDTTEYGKMQFFNLLIRRISNYTSSYYKIEENIRGLLGKENFSMLPTGGDLHCRGKNPYIVLNGKRKFVYKPRDMRSDYHITEALKVFNSISPNLKLPVEEIKVMEDAEHTGYMNFAEHKENMEQQEAEIYFQQLGALFCFCKLFGIRDLHHENIMATAKGPVIIDIECSFNQDIINQSTFDSMEFNDIKNVFNQSSLTNATFYIAHKMPKFNEPIVKNNMLQGFSKAAEACQLNKKKLLETYKQIMERKFKIRIVPKPTKELYSMMYLYYRCIEIQNKVLAGAAEDFMKNLRERFTPFFPVEMEEPEIAAEVENKIGQLVAADFFRGDIPILQVENNPSGLGKIYLDNCFLMDLDSEFQNIDRKLREFDRQIDWLAGEEAKDLFMRMFV